MKPTQKMIDQWRDGVENNATSENLKSMSAWLVRATKSCGMSKGTQDCAKRYAEIFGCIEKIHYACGAIPIEILNFRYRMRWQFLEWIKSLDPELYKIFRPCL